MLLLCVIYKIKKKRQFSGKKISINGLQIMLSDIEIIFRIELLPKFHYSLVMKIIDFENSDF